MFEKIKNDPYIHECYKSADNPESKDGFWVYHGLNHINNVIEMVEKVLIQLDYDDEYIENSKIAALLHDMGYGGIKKDHEIRSYEMAKDYFTRNGIELKYKDEILEAIKSHRNGFDNNSVMTLVLILADKTDIKKTRLAPEGYNIEGLNQYQYIEDINILKEKNNFVVKFIINEKCNKEQMESWYFTPKVINAINGFAKHFAFDLKILYNDSEWVIEN